MGLDVTAKISAINTKFVTNSRFIIKPPSCSPELCSSAVISWAFGPLTDVSIAPQPPDIRRIGSHKPPEGKIATTLLDQGFRPFLSMHIHTPVPP
jgi:hypothetical protein